MPETIQIRCNGEGKHINTVNIKELLEEGYVTAYRGVPPSHKDIPEKMVKRCAECSAYIVVTRRMVEENLGTEGVRNV